MDSAIFGPNDGRRLAEDALAALPFNWMTAACMDARFRRLSGWLGVAPCPGTPRAFTCRIAARPGVYGLAPACARNAADCDLADFEVFYFPAADDPEIEDYALAAAIAASRPGAAAWIRDFPSYPEAAAAFAVGEIRLAVSPSRRDIGLSLAADRRRRVIAPAGIAAPGGDGWLVAPGGLDENLPAFAVARDVFRVFAAGLSVATAEPPAATAAYETPAVEWRRRPNGGLDASPSASARRDIDVLAWGDPAALTAAFAVPGASPRAEAADAPYRICRAACDGEEPEAIAADRPRLIVLSGFLGAGKTSFLNQFIEFHAAYDRLVTVIQNELGDTGIDALLLEGDESVLAIDAGCVCCTLAGSLTPAIRRLTERFDPEIIVLEATGLANPLNMLAELKQLDHLVQLEAVVTLVDAARYADTLAVSDVARDQIAAADTVILNKCDLVDDAERGRIAADIRRRNPDARLIETSHGRVPPALLGDGLSRHAAAEEEPEDAACLCGCGRPHGHDHDHAHHGHDHTHVSHLDEGFAYLRLDLPGCIDRDELFRILAACPPAVRRIKGVVHLQGEAEPRILQYVPGAYDCVPAEKPVATPPFLIVIGRDLDVPALRRLWAPLTEGHVHAVD